MTFEMYFAESKSLERRMVGQNIIVKSSQPAPCKICGAKTYWRESVDMQPICSRQCLHYHLHPIPVMRDPAYAEIQEELRS